VQQSLAALKLSQGAGGAAIPSRGSSGGSHDQQQEDGHTLPALWLLDAGAWFGGLVHPFMQTQQVHAAASHLRSLYGSTRIMPEPWFRWAAVSESCACCAEPTDCHCAAGAGELQLPAAGQVLREELALLLRWGALDGPGRFFGVLGDGSSVEVQVWMQACCSVGCRDQTRMDSVGF
jgi:hypothetical protein